MTKVEPTAGQSEKQEQEHLRRIGNGGSSLIQIGGKMYELLHEHKNAWNVEAFRDRYSEVLERYDYIIGDWGYNQLRLKGFFKEGHPKANRDTTIAGLVDYINEYCNFGCAYFILGKADMTKWQGEPYEAIDILDPKERADEFTGEAPAGAAGIQILADREEAATAAAEPSGPAEDTASVSGETLHSGNDGTAAESRGRAREGRYSYRAGRDTRGKGGARDGHAARKRDRFEQSGSRGEQESKGGPASDHQHQNQLTQQDQQPSGQHRQQRKQHQGNPGNQRNGQRPSRQQPSPQGQAQSETRQNAGKSVQQAMNPQEGQRPGRPQADKQRRGGGMTGGSLKRAQPDQAPHEREERNAQKDSAAGRPKVRSQGNQTV